MTRRMLVLVVVLMGLTALVATLAPQRAVRPPARSTPRAASPTAVARAPDQPDVTTRLDGSPDKRPRTVRAELGDHVSILVSTDAPDSVALGNLDVQPSEPGLPARFDLLADTPGQYPLVLMSNGHQVGTLEVR
jgi:hypothetical protein